MGRVMSQIQVNWVLQFLCRRYLLQIIGKNVRKLLLIVLMALGEGVNQFHADFCHMDQVYHGFWLTLDDCLQLSGRGGRTLLYYGIRLS